MSQLVLSFLNLKGGVGKTSCSVGLAGGLAALGEAPVLIDMDPQNSATDHLTDQTPALTTASALSGACSLDATLIRSGFGINSDGDILLAASGEFSLVECEVSLKARGSKRRLRNLLRQMEGSACASGDRFVLVDTGPGLDFLWYNALFASDYVICPVELQMASIQGLRRFHDVLSFAREEDDLDVRVFYLPTNNDGRVRESKELLSLLLDQFGSFPRGAVLPSIRYSAAVSKAYAQRVTITEFDPSDRASEDFNSLAEIVLGWKKNHGK